MNGHIPESFINGLIERTSIIEVIEQHIPLKKRGTSFVACCPFHNEKNPSFNVSESKQLYHCFGCGAGGNVISFLMSYHNQNFVATCEWLAKRLGLELPMSQRQKQVKEKSSSLKDLLEQVSKYYQSELSKAEQARHYLQGRGLSKEIIEAFHIGFAPNAWHCLEKSFNSQKDALIETGMLIKKEDGNCYDRYRNRIMFPIQNEFGNVIGFGGRVLNKEDNPKYLNSPETPLFHKSYELYGLHQAKQQSIDSFIVVEGYLDVIALAQAGIKGAVATLGTTSTEHHLKKLTRLNPKVVFCFDGDAAGFKAAIRAMEQALDSLKDEHHYQFLCLPDNQDPDSFVREFGPETFLEKLKESPDLIEFLLSYLRQQVNLNQTAGRTKLISLARPFYSKMKAKTYQSIFVNKLSLLARIECRELSDLLKAQNNNALSSVEKAPYFPQASQKSRSLTPGQKAIALLIQNPSCYQEVEKHIHFEKLPPKGGALLKALAPHLSKGLKNAQLIEALRENPYAKELQKLAMVELLIPESGVAAELKDILERLERDYIKERIQALLQKAQAKTLTEEERKNLQSLILQSQLPKIQQP